MDFEWWPIEIEPGVGRPTDPRDWTGALVLVERGAVEVECIAGGHRTFDEGDMLALECLPIRTLRNPGSVTTRLVAVRRREGTSIPERRGAADDLASVLRAFVARESDEGAASMKFQATIRGTGKNTTGIPVPEAVMTSLGAGRRPPVKVTIGDHSYRSSVGTVDGAPMISLSVENREKAGVAAGETVEVDVELDTAPREVTVPQDLAEALDREPEARRFFDGLSYSNRRWHVESIEGARTDETRQRRIAKSVKMLREGRAR